MTDDDKTTGPAFKKVFGEGVKHLLCKWHLHCAWKKQLNNLVSGFEIRNEIYASLVVLLEEKNLTKFKQMMENFRVGFVDKEPAFIKYFDDYYYKRTDLWSQVPDCSQVVLYIQDSQLRFYELKSLDTYVSDEEENEEKITSHLHDSKAHLSTVCRISTERGEKRVSLITRIKRIISLSPLHDTSKITACGYIERKFSVTTWKKVRTGRGV
ncbi:hypothetical protein TNCV_4753661 [Trichonephila clavipes]|nr:hypothetical protein TNCV_4753661 [Trichonephila clavipes]